MPIGNPGGIAFANALLGIPAIPDAGLAVKQHFQELEQRKQQEIENQRAEQEFGLRQQQQGQSMIAKAVQMAEQTGAPIKDILGVLDPGENIPGAARKGLIGIDNHRRQKAQQVQADEKANKFSEMVGGLTEKIQAAGPLQRPLLIQQAQKIIGKTIQANPDLQQNEIAISAAEGLKNAIQADELGDRDTASGFGQKPIKHTVSVGGELFQDALVNPVNGDIIHKIGKPYKKKAGIEFNVGGKDKQIASGKAAIEPFTGEKILTVDSPMRTRFQGARALNGMAKIFKGDIAAIRQQGITGAVVGENIPLLANETVAKYDSVRENIVRTLLRMLSGVAVPQPEVDAQKRLLPSAQMWAVNPDGAQARWNRWVEVQSQSYASLVPAEISEDVADAMRAELSVGEDFSVGSSADPFAPGQLPSGGKLR